MSETARVTFDEYEAGELAVQYDDREPQEVIAWALETFGRRVAISTSLDADPMAILDMAWRIDPKVRVFTIDTLRLPKESYEFMATIEKHYGIAIETLRPDELEVTAMTAKHGPDLFRNAVPLRLLCCDVRKVRPLQRILPDLDAWITGLRRDQWASRSNIRKIELDHDHGGLVKVNPLADWMEHEVWDYNRANDDTIAEGEVPEELVGALETFLELALHRGRLRRHRGADADDALAALFFKTPGGSAARKAAHDVSRALGALAGQVVERISVAAVIGGHTVEIRTDQAQLVVELDRGGARIKSVEVGA